MNRTRTLICVLVVAVWAPFVEAGLQLNLRVEPQGQLPMILPTLRVTATNTGSAPAELPSSVALQVAPPGDRVPFIAYVGLRGEDYVTSFWVEGDDPIVLGPNETRDVSFWAGPESPVWFASDSRLLSPGTYRLQLVADSNLESARLEKLARADQQEGLASPVISNEATYTVLTPAGDDATVWNLIKNLKTPAFWTLALQAEIWAKYPNSKYAAYCWSLDTTRPAPEAAIAALNAALAKGPNAAWTEWYRRSIAEFELVRADSFVSSRDIESAVAAYDRARAILSDLVKHSQNPDLLAKARQMLENKVRTREQIIRYIQIENGELKETQPYPICVEQLPNGKHIFWFGYENVSPDVMRFPLGPRNKITPPPFDRGQPTIFPAGETPLGLRIETDEPAVMWHLDTFNVQASLAKTQPCPADLHERVTYRPPQRD